MSLTPEPKRYKAMSLPPEKPDRFNGFRTREVHGYYVKHVNATPYPISTKAEHDKFVEEHTEHYIMEEGFSDWGLPRDAKAVRIDRNTLEEIVEKD